MGYRSVPTAPVPWGAPKSRITPSNTQTPPAEGWPRHPRGARGSLGCRALVSLPGHFAQPGHPEISPPVGLARRISRRWHIRVLLLLLLAGGQGSARHMAPWRVLAPPKPSPRGEQEHPWSPLCHRAGLAAAGAATQICHQLCPGSALPQPPRQPGVGPGWDVDARHVPQRAPAVGSMRTAGAGQGDIGRGQRARAVPGAAP